MDLVEIKDREIILSSELIEVKSKGDNDSIFTLSIDGEQILYETYTPMNGQISIYGLNKYFSNPISLAVLTLDSIEYSCKVLKCEAEIVDELPKFLDRSFLSLLKEDKVIYPDTIEMVHCYPSRETNIFAEVTYKDANNSYSTDIKVIGKTVANKINSYEIRSSQWHKVNQTIVNFTIKCGLRSKRFLIDYSNKASASFIFKNVFGLPECVCLVGNQSYALSYKTEFGNFNGQYKKLDTVQEKVYTVTSGILPTYQVEWIANDLLLSKDVTILKDGKMWKGATITEDKVEISKNETANANIEIKYRLNQQTQYITDFEKYLVRVFTNQFDTQFS